MIKFRAWDKRENTMRDVAVLHFTKGGKVNSIEYWKTPSELKSYHVRNLILMQSTGLKDLKGVEIFEGDVVWIIDKEEMDNGWGWFEEVKFRNGSFMVGDNFLINSHHCCVVHGNIHANQELLS